MQLLNTFRELGDWSRYGLDRLVPPADDPLWNERQQRQGTYAVHRETRSILFKWLDNSWIPGQPFEIAILETGNLSLDTAVNAAADALAVHFDGFVVKLMLAELPPGASIAEHRDAGPALAFTHRCHIPIVTNDGVEFLIDRRPHRLSAGIAYEIDNTRAHSVANHGATRRVHLICDVMGGSARERLVDNIR